MDVNSCGFQPLLNNKLSLPNAPEVPDLINKETDSLPLDSFHNSSEELSAKGLENALTSTAQEPSSRGLKAAVASALVSIIDMPVLTMAPKITDEKRETILNLIKPGDVILETDSTTPGWSLFEKLGGGGDYTHAAIYEGEGKFLEATTEGPTGKGVIRSDLREYLQGRLKVEIIRPDYKSEKDIDTALDYARGQLGKPYDSDFDTVGDDKMYCSELVAKSLAAMPNKIFTPTVKVMGKELILPTAFQDLKNAKTIYSDHSSFLKTLKESSAGLIATVVGSAVCSFALGPVGMAVGAAIGLATGMGGGLVQAALDQYSEKKA